MHQVLDVLTEGRSTVLNTVTVPPGFTSLQIVERLRNDANLTGDITEVPPEGTLLPDTYKIVERGNPGRVLEHMRIKQQDRVTALGTSASRTCHSKRWSRPSCWPRSSRRRRARAMNASELRLSSSTGCARTCPCSRIRPSSTGSMGAGSQWGRPILRSEIDAKNTAQHVSNSRPAADADLQPEPRRDQGGAQSDAVQRPVLRGRRAGWTYLH